MREKAACLCTPGSGGVSGWTMSIVGSTVRDSPVVTIIGVDDGSLDGDGGVSAQYDKLEGKQAVTARLIT